MRPCARALETRREVVDPPTRLPVDSVSGFQSRQRRRASNQLLRRSHDALGSACRPRRSEPSFGREMPVRTPGKIDKPLWAPTFGGPAETKKARSVVASSRVPRLAGFAGSPPAAGLPGAVNWPLVQIPADRHTTTGTCVLGDSQNRAKRASAQEVSSSPSQEFCDTVAKLERNWTLPARGGGLGRNPPVDKPNQTPPKKSIFGDRPNACPGSRFKTLLN